MGSRRARWTVLVGQGPGVVAGLGVAAAVLWPLHPRVGPTIWLAWACLVPLASATAAGERFGIHLVHVWAPLSLPEAALIRQLSARHRVDLGDVDLYVTRADTGAGAGSTGRRTIVFGAGLLAAWRSGAITDRPLVAVAAHELAHLRHHDQRAALTVFWLALPWTILKAVVTAVAGRLLPRRVYLAGLGVVLAVAAVRAVLAGDWVTVGALALLIGWPLLGPRLGRAGLAQQEQAADAEVGRLGLGPHLRTARELVRAGAPVHI